jgi:hypothetical protein
MPAVKTETNRDLENIIIMSNNTNPTLQPWNIIKCAN